MPCPACRAIRATLESKFPGASEGGGAGSREGRTPKPAAIEGGQEEQQQQGAQQEQRLGEGEGTEREPSPGRQWQQDPEQQQEPEREQRGQEGAG